MYAIGDKEWSGLGKLIEEMGELQQAIGKLMALHGDADVSHFDGQGAMLLRIEDEIADVLAAIKFVTSVNDMDLPRILERSNMKAVQFRAWHDRPQVLRP